ncbi:plasmid mobilization relaxosome protein MobC [bacterium]|nr:plasmid mobilization relaxosome protein MobC [bacterium]
MTPEPQSPKSLRLAFEDTFPAARGGGRKRTPPFSLRLSQAEREQLEREAGDRPLGAYVKEKVFGDSPPVRNRRTGLSVDDRKALAQALALLGQSRIASNLNQLAKAVNMGALPLSPHAKEELRECCAVIREIRGLLMRAMGLQTGGSP